MLPFYLTWPMKKNLKLVSLKKNVPTHTIDLSSIYHCSRFCNRPMTLVHRLTIIEMNISAFENNSSGDKYLYCLLASGILPFLTTSIAGDKTARLHIGKLQNLAQEFNETIERYNLDYFGISPKYS